MHATAPRTTDASRSHSAVPSADTLADGAVGGSSSRESADRPSRRRTSDNTQPPAPRRDRPWRLPLGVTPAAPGARVGARPRCTSAACTRARSVAVGRGRARSTATSGRAPPACPVSRARHRAADPRTLPARSRPGRPRTRSLTALSGVLLAGVGGRPVLQGGPLTILNLPRPGRDRPWKLPLGVTPAAPGARVGRSPAAPAARPSRARPSRARPVACTTPLPLGVSPAAADACRSSANPRGPGLQPVARRNDWSRSPPEAVPRASSSCPRDGSNRGAPDHGCDGARSRASASCRDPSHRDCFTWNALCPRML